MYICCNSPLYEMKQIYESLATTMQKFPMMYTYLRCHQQVRKSPLPYSITRDSILDYTFINVADVSQNCLFKASLGSADQRSIYIIQLYSKNHVFACLFLLGCIIKFTVNNNPTSRYIKRGRDLLLLHLTAISMRYLFDILRLYM